MFVGFVKVGFIKNFLLIMYSTKRIPMKLYKSLKIPNYSFIFNLMTINLEPLGRSSIPKFKRILISWFPIQNFYSFFKLMVKFFYLKITPSKIPKNIF